MGSRESSDGMYWARNEEQELHMEKEERWRAEDLEADNGGAAVEVGSSSG